MLILNLCQAGTTGAAGLVAGSSTSSEGRCGGGDGAVSSGAPEPPSTPSDPGASNPGSDPGVSSPTSALERACSALEWLDSLLQELWQQPGFRETVLLSVVLGPAATLPEPHCLPAAEQPALALAGAPDAPLVGRPLLSYRTRGGGPAAVDRQRPAVAIHHLPGVIRSGTPSPPAGAATAACQAALASRHRSTHPIPPSCLQILGSSPPPLCSQAFDSGPPPSTHPPPTCRHDRVVGLDLGYIAARGGAGCILAERLLPELAYKLGRAQKYGA